MFVIGAVAIFDGDVTAVSGAILILLVSLGIAELREIKTSTNGNTSNLMEQNRMLLAEISHYRRQAADFANRALEAPPLSPQTPVPDPSAMPSVHQAQHQMQPSPPNLPYGP